MARYRRWVALLLIVGVLGPNRLLASALDVLAEAAMIGGYGLEVTVGSTCTGLDVLVLDVDDSPATGAHEGCLEIIASEVMVSGFTTFTAGETISLGDGFSVDQSASFAAGLEPYLATPFASILDLSPLAEVAYTARFWLHADDLGLGASETLDHFVGYSEGGEVEFKVVLQAATPGPGHELTLAARETGGSYSSTASGQEIALVSGWNKVDLQWARGPGDGFLRIAVNDGPFSGLSSLTNDDSLVGSVRWGAIDGALTDGGGALRLDGFDSWR